MEKITIRIPKPKMVAPADFCGTVRITPEAESILRRFVRETGMSMRYIVSRIIEEAADSIDWEWEDD